jgi:hypothetical protein
VRGKIEKSTVGVSKIRGFYQEEAWLIRTKTAMLPWKAASVAKVEKASSTHENCTSGSKPLAAMVALRHVEKAQNAASTPGRKGNRDMIDYLIAPGVGYQFVRHLKFSIQHDAIIMKAGRADWTHEHASNKRKIAPEAPKSRHKLEKVHHSLIAESFMSRKLVCWSRSSTGTSRSRSARSRSGRRQIRLNFFACWKQSRQSKSRNRNRLLSLLMSV